MERYESLGPVGEGSYGTVLKCRHRDSGRLVAIKKFMESDDDKMVKKIALREIKLLRQLRHDNLVNLLEVWKRRRRWYLVFEFVDRTLLYELEQNPNGLDMDTSRQHLFQILRAAAFCHHQNIIHRDIKPENILISQGGVVKLCDFGFARTVASPAEGGAYTDYVATRWYRAPELLVGDIKYGKPVDVWALGCLLMEMLTGQPLFPGDSDLDQIYHVVRCFGHLTSRHQELFYRNPVFSGVRLPECVSRVSLQQRFPTITPSALDLAQRCLEMDPERRAHCSQLLEHPLFIQDSFHIRFLDELNVKIQKDHRENSTFPKITKTPRQERDEGEEKSRRGKDKKQPEDMDVKVNKEKPEKTKGKQASKLSKAIRDTSEPLTSTKQSKTLGIKVINNAAQSSIAVKSKPGKATGAEGRKDSEVSKVTKTFTLDSSEAAKTATSLKDKNTVAAKPKHEKVVCPEPKEDSLKSIKDKECRDSDNIVPSAHNKSIAEIQRSSKTDNTNPKVLKWSKNVTANRPKLSCLESAVDRTDASNNHSEVVTPSIRSVTEISATSPRQAKRPTADTGRRRTSECSQVSNSNKMNTNPSSPPGSPSKTPTSDLSTQSVTAFKETKGVSNPKPSKTGSTSKGLPKDREPTEDIEDDHGCLKMSPVTETAANHIQISRASGGDTVESPDSSETSCLRQQSASNFKITTEARTTSTSTPNENSSAEITILETLKVSDKENREDLSFSVPIIKTDKSSVHLTLKASGSRCNERNDGGDLESDVKSLKAPQPKSLVGGPKTKPRSFSNHMRSSVTPKTQKTTFSTDARKKSDNPDRNDTTNTSPVTDLTSINVDAAELIELDYSVPHPSPPPPPPPPLSPPPPPPSSTPLLLPPSSTALNPVFSAVSTNYPAVGDHLTQGTGFHPGSHRCVDTPGHRGGVYGRQAQQLVSSHAAGSFSFQPSEKSPICERPFLSDRGNLGNGSGVALTKNKSHIHFPNLRSSVLPELRGREGKHNKVTTKDQRKEKQPASCSPPAEPRQHRHILTKTNTVTP